MQAAFKTHKCQQFLQKCDPFNGHVITVQVMAVADVSTAHQDAVGTVFTHVSMAKIGASAVQSRACGGVAGGTYLFALPGSPSACRDAWDQILSLQLDYRHRPCNFIEIMPRLERKARSDPLSDPGFDLPPDHQAKLDQLRKKLEDRPAQPSYIVTVHRVGYKFTA